MLDDAALPGAIADGRLPYLGWTTLYEKGAETGAERRIDTFLRYRRSALRRREIRTELGLATPGKLAALELRRERVVRAFDLMVEREERVRAALVEAARRMADEERGGAGPEAAPASTRAAFAATGS